MSPTPHLSAAQLHHAAEIQTKIEALQAELARLFNGTASSVNVVPVRTAAPAPVPAMKRKLSAAGRARTIAGSKAYWARRRAAAKPTTPKTAAPAPVKRSRISAAGRRRIAAAAKARWAKAKAAGKKRL